MTSQIIPQNGEFSCADAVVKTVINMKYKRDPKDHNSLFHIRNIGTLNFLSFANQTLRKNNISTHFIRKTSVKFQEIENHLNDGRVIVVLFISRENYLHYAILLDISNDLVTIANTHGPKIEKFPSKEFIERLYLNTRYIENIEWIKGRNNFFMDKALRLMVRFAKVIGLVRPSTIFILEDTT